MDLTTPEEAAEIQHKEKARIPDGYYAIEGPSELDGVTYWRKKGQEFKPWPPKARYGPIAEIKRSDLPADRMEREETLRKLHTDQVLYIAHAAGIIRSDVEVARARFARLCTRCWSCGKKLTDNASKVYGIGPDCRSGMSDEVLATSARAVGHAHASYGV